jgi:glycosyltransferase involved in cell wall biosynthesis
LSESVAAAAIYYDPDGYDTSRRRLMGRQAAGAGFLAGYARHGRSDPVWCFAGSDELARRFASQVREAQTGRAPARERGVRWLSRDRPEQLAEVGCLFYPSPVIAAFAWQRRHADQRAYSLCGVTHTTASDTVMEAFGAFATAPLQSWDAVICTSNAVRRTIDCLLDEWRDYLAARLGAAGTAAVRLQLPVIPLGVDCAAFAPDAATGIALRKQLGIVDDAVAALFLGRLTAAAKAHPMQMFHGLELAAARTGRTVHLLLVGWFEHDKEEHQFRALATAFAPSIHLHILDGRDAALRMAAWAAADLFTSLSDNIQETFGLTPVEAMAAGKPLVISEWNGYRETMTHGEHGFFVPTLAMPPGDGGELARRYRADLDSYGAYIGRTAQFSAADPQAVVEAYQRLVGDAGLRRRLGEAGRRHARENYDWSVIIPRYEALWNELAARRKHDDEIAAPQAGRAAEPLRHDPATLFAHYPSRTLADSDRVSAWADAPEFDAVIGSPLNVFANRLMLLRKEAAALRAAIAAPARAAPPTVGELLQTLPPERRAAARRTLVWMQKMDLIRIAATQPARSEPSP